jgi:hypothetical protein
MNIHVKKIFVLICVFVLVAAVGTVVVSSQMLDNKNRTLLSYSFINPLQKPSYKDLVEKWEEIQQAKQELHEMLEEFGVDIPDLTKAQKMEIFNTVRDLRKKGVGFDVIRDVVIDMLIEFGFELPDLTKKQREEIRIWIINMLESDYGFEFVKLTDKQREEIKSEIIVMLKNGASKEEIREQVKTMLRSYGWTIPDLTEEEKETIKNRIKEMLETEYGIEFPDLTIEQKEAIKNKKEEIRGLQKELHEMLKEANKFTKWLFFRYIKKNLQPKTKLFKVLSSLL